MVFVDYITLHNEDPVDQCRSSYSPFFNKLTFVMKLIRTSFVDGVLVLKKMYTHSLGLSRYLFVYEVAQHHS